MIPTYEEYEQGVKKQLAWSLRLDATGEKLQKYLDSDTVNDEIKVRYPADVESYKKKHFRDVVWKDAEASVAYCLYMMYEE